MSIEEILTNLGNYFSNFGNSLLNFFVKIGEFFSSISDSIINVSSFIISIFGFLFHALKTLLVGVWNLIIYIVDSDVWFNSIQALTTVSDYIGFPAVMFIISMVLVVLVRVVIAFIFKILRINIDYNALNRKTYEANSWANSTEYHKRLITKK